MKTQPIVAAHIDFGDVEAPRSVEFDDVYHARGGALAQARHVFLAGNGLPRRWAGARRFVVVETGFGLGNNFLAAWDAWRADPQRPQRLEFVSLELHPPRREDLERAHAASPLPELAAQLAAAWPPLVPGLHPVDFEAGRVRLLLGLGDVHALLPQLQLRADAFFLDGFAPARNPAMWDRRMCKALARLAAPGATAATWSVAREVREGLAAAGFAVERSAGFDRKREMTSARWAPAFTPRRAPARASAIADDTSARSAVVVGAGIAGACAAAALARAGWACTVLDRHAQPAGEASGNPAGLFHATVHADDGVHARFTRAAALFAHRVYAPLVARGAVAGHVDGLLRAHPGTTHADVPEPFARRLGRAELAGLVPALHADAAWFFPAGGWVAPPQAVRALLAAPGVAFRGNCPVTALRRLGGTWQCLGDNAQVLAEAPVVVLAAAHATPALLAASALAPSPPWRTTRTRGQVTWFARPAAAAPLSHPVAGHGYAIARPDGTLLCGASAQPGDDDATVRDADHRFNLQRLRELTGIEPPPGAALHGRAGWREVAKDRLPIVGALPAVAAPAGTRLDQARFVPRVPGIHVLGALGGRGLTWAPLAGELLAAWIDGAPLPLEADLVDALDPARWIVHAARAVCAAKG